MPARVIVSQRNLASGRIAVPQPRGWALDRTLVGQEAAEGGGFLPTDISGLDLWLRADQIGGLSDGDPISTWSDESGNNNDFTQASSKRPTWQTNEINSLAVVRFDGSDDIMTAPNFSSDLQGTIFAVVRMTAAIDDFQAIIASADEAGTAKYIWFFSYRDAGTASMEVNQRNSDTADQINGDTAISATTVYLMTWRSSGTAYAFRVNGSAETLAVNSGANNGDWFGDVDARDNFSVGGLKRNSEAFQLKGDIGEVVMYDSELSSGDTSSVETYLNDKWSIY